MKLIPPFQVNPIDMSLHWTTEMPTGPDPFKEQMAVLHLAGIDAANQNAMFIRSFVTIGTPGMCGFDAANPGMDTAQGWNSLDSLIENNLVRGLFHTHPSGFHTFSAKDRESQIALAKANGSRLIWHMVQAAGPALPYVICMQMLGHQVYTFDFGFIEGAADVTNPIVLLPLPPKVESEAGGVWIEC